MAQIVSDNFDGAVSQTLQAYNPSWVKVTSAPGDMIITAGGAVTNAGGATGSYYRSDAAVPGADYSVTADITTGSSILGVTLRTQTNAATFYQARFSGNTLELYRFVNGSGTLLASSPTGLSGSQNFNICLQGVGPALKVFLDRGAEAILSRTDSSIAAAGFPGIRAGTGTGSIDNFSADTIPVENDAISATLAATLDGASISSSAQLQAAGALATTLDPAALSSSGALSSMASLAKTLAVATVTATVYIETGPPGPDGIEGTLSRTLAAATLSATANSEVKGALSSTLGGTTLAAAARTAPAFDISQVHSSRVVVFGGSGSRVVIFEGSGSRVVVFEGSGTRIRINEMDVKVPIKDGAKWKVDRDRDEISYYAADITDELRDRNTTAVQSEVVALPYGVEILEQAEIQVATIEGVERVFVVVKLGGVDGELPDDWRWVARVPCANGERFDKTTWFNEVDP